MKMRMIDQDHIARRVAIQQKVARKADALAGLRTTDHQRWGTVDDKARWVGLELRLGTREDLRASLLSLAAECQSWLEAIAAEEAR